MKTDLTVGAYIFHEDKVLLIHHRKLDIWVTVGGHIDSDENTDEAILREIKEETGIDVELLNKSDIPIEGNIKFNLSTPFYVNVHSVGDHDHCCFYYVCKAVNPGELKTNYEVKNFDWFTKEDLNKNHVPVDVKNQALKAFEIYEKFNN